MEVREAARFILIRNLDPRITWILIIYSNDPGNNTYDKKVFPSQNVCPNTSVASSKTPIL